MSSVVVRPLVVVREHSGGFFSAFPAVDPALISYGDEPEQALDELRLFLSEHFSRIDPDDVLEFVVPEPASTREVSVMLPRADAARDERVRTPISITVVELEGARGARWMLIPVLNQVCYVPEEHAADPDALLSKEIVRLAAASDIGGADYFDLLPTTSFELERLGVEVDREAGKERESTRRARAERQKLRAARKLLASVAQLLKPGDDEVLHRDIAGLRSLLESPSRSSVALVGPAGGGKSALMRAASRGLGREVHRTSGAELVAGQSFVGQLEQRVDDVMKAVELLDVVLYFEAFDDLFAGQSGGYEDIAGAMQRYIERGRVRIVGELDPEQYDRLQHRHVGFFSHLHRISAEALDRAQTIDVLEARGQAARRREHPALEPAAIPLVVDLVERYEPYRSLPGKAVALVEELVAARRAEGQTDGPLELRTDDVLRHVSVKTGVPEFLLRDERSLLLERVEETFRRGLVGQESAVRRVAETLCAVKAGLQPGAKPLSTFLFVGPTGVGKTELAKALARFLFGSAERLARFDMSEYSDAYAADRLIRGTDHADGVLTRRIREQPFSVLLLDEIEKASPAVFDLLLQVCGEGRLSDAEGRVAYFKNSIIVMTSNLGAQHRGSVLGFGGAEVDDANYYMQQVREHFRPEFLNRLDTIVCFSSLTREQIHDVAKLSTDRIARRVGFEEQGIRVWVADDAIAALSDDGFSPDYGARGLRRHLEQALTAPISHLVAQLGASASGQLIAVHSASRELENKELCQESGEPALSEELLRLERGGLSFRVMRRKRRRELTDLTGVVAISAKRRQTMRWSRLPPITALRERLGEIAVELNRGSRRRARRQTSGMDTLLGRLSIEHGSLQEILRPLDEAHQELESIEELVVGSVYDNDEPKFFETEADAAFQRFRRHLVAALLATSQENEIALIAHDLDEGGALRSWTDALLASLDARGWQGLVHVDRGERKPEQVWPTMKKRRWGPPLTPNEFVERHGGPNSERPFSSLMVRVKGPAAGALLSFAVGRYRYHSEQDHEELWVRLARPRWQIDEEDWKTPALAPTFDREVGVRQPLRVSFGEDPGKARTDDADLFLDGLVAGDLFRRWEELVFDWVVDVAEGGDPYLPPG